jgi:hypothetical protein
MAGNGIDRAQDVGTWVNATHLGSVGDDRVQVAQVESAVVGDTDPAQGGPLRRASSCHGTRLA